jgi:hypothetical protein
MKAGEAGVKKPILVAGGKVIDGHHRWAAYKLVDPDMVMKVVEVKTTPEEVIRMANQYGARSEKLATAFDAAMAAEDGKLIKDERDSEMTQRGMSVQKAARPEVSGYSMKPNTGAWYADKTKRRSDAEEEVKRTHGDEMVTSYDE